MANKPSKAFTALMANRKAARNALQDEIRFKALILKGMHAYVQHEGYFIEVTYDSTTDMMRRGTPFNGSHHLKQPCIIA